MVIRKIEQETIHHSNAIKDGYAGTVNRIGDKLVIIGAPDYEGEYVVRSSAKTEKVLPTRGRIMKDDVTVQTISYWETANDDGTTVYIGVD